MKSRAVFLAALMISSVIAMGATFAGPAGAVSANTVEFDPFNPWHGQDVTATSNAFVVEGEETEYQLRRVTDWDGTNVSSSTFVRDEVVNENDEIVIDTEALDVDDYFLRGPGLPHNPGADSTFEVRIQDLAVAFDDDEVTDAGDDARTDLDIESNRGRYTVNVSADGDLDTEELLSIFVHNESLVEGLLNESIRELIETDANGNIHGTLDQTTIDQINDILETYHDYDRGWDNRTDNPFSVLAYDPDEADADETVVMYRITDREEEVDFTDIDAGEYEFIFEVDDTEAEASATIVVTEEDVSVVFDRNVYVHPAGDILEFSIELEDTDEAYLQFGDEDAGFIDIIYIEDDGGTDGQVDFLLNTRMIGTNASNDVVVWSEDDIVESFIAVNVDTDDISEWSFIEGETPRFWDDSDMPDGEEIHFGEYLAELDLLSSAEQHPTEQIVRPIQAVDYDIAATTSPNFIAEDGVSELDSEDGFAVVDLIRPEVGDIIVWIGPEEDADDTDDIRDLLADLTQRSSVAVDDLLVVQIQATGIYGHMVAIDPDGFDALEDGFQPATFSELTKERTGEGIEFTFEDPFFLDHQLENQLDLETATSDEIFILADNTNGNLYLVINTEAEPFTRSLRAGGEFLISMEYVTDSDGRFRFDTWNADLGGDWETIATGQYLGGADGNQNDEAYPYYRPGDVALTTATVTFVERSVTFDSVLDGSVQIANTESSVISGTTTVAPETTASVRVRNRGDTPSFLVTQSVDIANDGSFSAEFDFSDRAVGEAALVSFRAGGSRLGQQNGIFVEEIVDMTPYSLTVTVLDADAQPIDGVTLRAGNRAAETDGDGVGTLDLPAGDYTVRAIASGFETTTVDVTVDRDRDITMVMQADDVVADLSAQIEELQVFLAHLEQDRDRIAGERDALAALVEQLEGELADRDARINALERQLDDMEEQPGFGLVVALMALVVASGLAVRYRRR